MLFDCLTENLEEEYNVLVLQNYPPIPPHYSKEINDLLSLLLEQSADKRLSIDSKKTLLSC